MELAIVVAGRSWLEISLWKTGKTGREVDYQVAAPTESSTPKLHRATIAQQRVRMEGWRQERLGSRAGTHREEEKNKNILTEKEKKKNILDTHRPSHGRPIWTPTNARAVIPKLCTQIALVAVR